MSTMEPAGLGGGGGENTVGQSTTSSAQPPTQQQQQHPPPSPLSGCYLLVVLPEPRTAQHKDLILNRLAKGFLSWDKDSCHVDLEKELQALVAQAPEGEEARNGERLIQYATENLVTEVLIHPQTNTLLQCIRNLLASFTKHRHIIHAGYTFGGNGSWILQDGTFSLADFLDAFSEHEVQRVLRAYENSVTVDIHCANAGDWSTARLSKEPCTRACRVRVNPDDVLTAGVPAITAFTNYIEQYLIPQTLDQLMEPSDVVGNIRFSHPTLYVFPGGQGDAALFGINGFNMLVDGGFARKACFWDFTRHLDRLDAVLVTRINNSNVGGISSVLKKKKETHVYPQIGHFFCNLIERRHSASPDGDKDLDPLIVDLIDIGQEMMVNLRHISLRPHSCYRDPDPINLYHKVGHGTLDMYVLSPNKDSREVREFLAKWNASDSKLFAGGHRKDSNNLTFPLQNLVSICALLVWQPANPEDTITRILFPGSTPQHRIFEGFERLKHLEFLKHPVCSAKSLSPSTSLEILKDKPAKQKLELKKKEKAKEEALKPVPAAAPSPKPVKAEPKVKKALEEKEKKVVETKAKKVEKELKKEVKKSEVIKDEADKVVKPKPEPKPEPKIEKSESKPETKPESKPEPKLEAKKKEVKEPKMVVKKAEAKSQPAKPAEKKSKEPKEKKDTVKSSPTTPKKTLNGVATKVEISKAATRPATKVSKPSVAPAKSAKDANNRKVVEQKNIETKAKSKAVERKPISRRTKPVSPSKPRVPGSPAKTAVATKETAVRKPKGDKGTTDSSTVSTPSGLEPESVIKPTEKSEDLSLDSIESKVLADLKEEREVVEEIEAVLQKAERIEERRKEEHFEGDDEVTAEATDKKEEDVTEEDVTAEIEDAPKKQVSRKESQELTEEDEYLIVEAEDSVQSGEPEQKHHLDEAESEKVKMREEEKEVAEEKKDEVPEKEVEVVEKIVEEKVAEKAAEVEPMEKEKADVVAEPVAAVDQKVDAAKKEPEDEKKEALSSSPDKMDSSEKKSSDTDVKPEKEQIPEKLEESQERISTIESGGTTTAPTLPEDERIPLDEIAEDVDEKHVIEDVKEKEVPVKPVEAPIETAAPIVPKPDVAAFQVRQPAQSMQRDIVKTPDEVADLPVHEEVDPISYRIDDFEKDKEEKPQPVKDQKGVFGFFGKVADKFEKGIDKLTKKKKDTDKDTDDKSSSKSSSPKEPKPQEKVELDMEKVFPKVTKKEQEIFEEAKPQVTEVKTAAIKETTAFIQEEIADAQRTAPPEAKDEIEEVEALLEEASMKFKTVKDSLRDSLESLEEKEQPPQLADLPSPKDIVKDTLTGVAEKLEEIKPGLDVKEPEKVKFAVPDKEVIDEDVEEEEGPFRDVKEAVRDVGEVLAGSTGIALEEKPKDVEEIVKKVAEVLKEDDFLSEKVLFPEKEKVEDVAIIPKKVGVTEELPPHEEIEDMLEMDMSTPLPTYEKAEGLQEVHEEPCVKVETKKDVTVVSPVKDTTEDLKSALEMSSELLQVDVQRKKRSIPEAEDDRADVLASGEEVVCKKIELPREEKDVEEPVIGFEQKLTPAKAELVTVTPGSTPTSPKFTAFNIDDVKTIFEKTVDLEEATKELILTAKQKITREIIEYISSVRGVSKMRIIYIIERIIIKHKLPRESVVSDITILRIDDSVDPEKRVALEDYIVKEYVEKKRKITMLIIEEISMLRIIPRRVVMETIEEIIVRRNVPRDSLLTITENEYLEAYLGEPQAESPEKSTKEVEKEKLVNGQDTIVDGFVSIASKETVQEFLDKEKEVDDFEAVEQECRVDEKMPRKLSEVTKKDIEETADEDISDVIEADEKFVRETAESLDKDMKDHGKSETEISEVSDATEKYLIEAKEKTTEVDKVKEVEKTTGVYETKDVEKAIEVDKMKEIEKAVEADIAKEVEKVVEVDKTKEVEKAVEVDKTKEVDKAKEVDKMAETDKAKEVEKQVETDKAKEVEKAVEVDKAKEVDKIAEMDKAKEVEKVFEVDKAKEVEKVVEVDKAKEVEKTAEVDKMKETDTSVEVDKAKEMEKSAKIDTAADATGMSEKLPEMVEKSVADKLQERRDKEAGTVRRMVVTASSEDGGLETEICPSGSITFTKTVTPDDSLKDVSVKSTPDKDSLHLDKDSLISSPDKDSFSEKSIAGTKDSDRITPEDSLEKSVSTTREPQELDDSLEKKAVVEKLSLLQEKPELESDGIRSPESVKSDDLSPAESDYGRSPTEKMQPFFPSMSQVAEEIEDVHDLKTTEDLDHDVPAEKVDREAGKSETEKMEKITADVVKTEKSRSPSLVAEKVDDQKPDDKEEEKKVDSKVEEKKVDDKVEEKKVGDKTEEKEVDVKVEEKKIDEKIDEKKIDDKVEEKTIPDKSRTPSLVPEKEEDKMEQKEIAMKSRTPSIVDDKEAVVKSRSTSIVSEKDQTETMDMREESISPSPIEKKMSIDASKSPSKSPVGDERSFDESKSMSTVDEKSKVITEDKVDEKTSVETSKTSEADEKHDVKSRSASIVGETSTLVETDKLDDKELISKVSPVSDEKPADKSRSASITSEKTGFIPIEKTDEKEQIDKSKSPSKFPVSDEKSIDQSRSPSIVSDKPMILSDVKVDEKVQSEKPKSPITEQKEHDISEKLLESSPLTTTEQKTSIESSRSPSKSPVIDDKSRSASIVSEKAEPISVIEKPEEKVHTESHKPPIEGEKLIDRSRSASVTSEKSALDVTEKIDGKESVDRSRSPSKSPVSDEKIDQSESASIASEKSITATKAEKAVEKPDTAISKSETADEKLIDRSRSASVVSEKSALDITEKISGKESVDRSRSPSKSPVSDEKIGQTESASIASEKSVIPSTAEKTDEKPDTAISKSEVADDKLIDRSRSASIASEKSAERHDVKEPIVSDKSPSKSPVVEEKLDSKSRSASEVSEVSGVISTVEKESVSISKSPSKSPVPDEKSADKSRSASIVSETSAFVPVEPIEAKEQIKSSKSPSKSPEMDEKLADKSKPSIASEEVSTVTPISKPAEKEDIENSKSPVIDEKSEDKSRSTSIVSDQSPFVPIEKPEVKADIETSRSPSKSPVSDEKSKPESRSASIVSEMSTVATPVVATERKEASEASKLTLKDSKVDEKAEEKSRSASITSEQLDVTDIISKAEDKETIETSKSPSKSPEDVETSIDKSRAASIISEKSAFVPVMKTEGQEHIEISKSPSKSPDMDAKLTDKPRSDSDSSEKSGITSTIDKADEKEPLGISKPSAPDEKLGDKSRSGSIATGTLDMTAIVEKTGEKESIDTSRSPSKSPIIDDKPDDKSRSGSIASEKSFIASEKVESKEPIESSRSPSKSPVSDEKLESKSRSASIVSEKAAIPSVDAKKEKDEIDSSKSPSKSPIIDDKADDKSRSASITSEKSAFVTVEKAEEKEHIETSRSPSKSPISDEQPEDKSRSVSITSEKPVTLTVDAKKEKEDIDSSRSPSKSPIIDDKPDDKSRSGSIASEKSFTASEKVESKEPIESSRSPSKSPVSDEKLESKSRSASIVSEKAAIPTIDAKKEKEDIDSSKSPSKSPTIDDKPGDKSRSGSIASDKSFVTVEKTEEKKHTETSRSPSKSPIIDEKPQDKSRSASIVSEKSSFVPIEKSEEKEHIDSSRSPLKSPVDDRPIDKSRSASIMSDKSASLTADVKEERKSTESSRSPSKSPVESEKGTDGSKRASIISEKSSEIDLAVGDEKTQEKSRSPSIVEDKLEKVTDFDKEKSPIPQEEKRESRSPSLISDKVEEKDGKVHEVTKTTETSFEKGDSSVDEKLADKSSSVASEKAGTKEVAHTSISPSESTDKPTTIDKSKSTGIISDREVEKEPISKSRSESIVSDKLDESVIDKPVFESTLSSEVEEKELVSKSRSGSIVDDKLVEKSSDKSRSSSIVGDKPEEKELTSKSRSASIVTEKLDEPSIHKSISPSIVSDKPASKSTSETVAHDKLDEKSIDRSRSSSLVNGKVEEKEKSLEKDLPKSVDSSKSHITEKEVSKTDDKKAEEPIRSRSSSIAIDKDKKETQEPEVEKSRSSSIAEKTVKDLADKLRSASITSEAESIDRTKSPSSDSDRSDDKGDKPSLPLDQKDFADKLKSLEGKEPSIESKFEDTVKYGDSKLAHSETPTEDRTPKDRSRSHSVYEGGEKTPLGRSRTASLYDDKLGSLEQIKSAFDIPEEKCDSRKTSITEEKEEQEKVEEDLSKIPQAIKQEVEKYIVNEYITKNRKITSKTLDEIAKLHSVSKYVVISVIEDVIVIQKLRRGAVYEPDAESESEKLEATRMSPSSEQDGSEHSEPCIDEEVSISEQKRNDVENFLLDNYVLKGRKITESEMEDIVVKTSLPRYIICEIIMEIVIKKKISKESLADKTIFHDDLDDSLERSPMHKVEPFQIEKSSGYSTPETRDGKSGGTFDYESQFHKAFVGGMTEMRTTHITTLSGKSTPDFGHREGTPDSEITSTTSEKTERKVESSTKDGVVETTVILRSTQISSQLEDASQEEISEATGKDNLDTGYTEHAEHSVSPVIRDLISEDRSYSGKSSPDISLPKDIVYSESTGKSTPDVPASPLVRDGASMQSYLSGRSTPDRRSRTATPEGFRSGEVLRTIITTTRTMSDDGNIITTTKEVTESTNERGETVVLAEKTESEVAKSPRHRLEELDEPVEYSGSMSSSFYGEMPTGTEDYSFKKFTVEKEYAGASEEKAGAKKYVDEADLDFEKVMKEEKDEHKDEDRDEKKKKDPLEDWGSPLGLPSPKPPRKFNLRSPAQVSLSSSTDLTPDSLNFDAINDWGEPLRLPSPAPTNNEGSNKSPGTPQKEKKVTRKVISENIKNRKRSESPGKSEKKLKDSKNKMQPVYMDLTYVPHHGNSFYTALDFFKKVRARYYVFSGIEPSREVYDALLEAKKTWEDKDLEVTMIPTYDTDTLGYWVADNEEALAANHIDLSPSASRCTINLQDHETSCSAYRLEF